MLSLQKKGAVQTKDGVEFAVIDGIVGAQGPVNTTPCKRRFRWAASSHRWRGVLQNYALSKRLQNWRAMTARNAGQLVSINVAPSTATASVVSNKSFAAAFEGMASFPPMEIMREETSRAVVTPIPPDFLLLLRLALSW